MASNNVGAFVNTTQVWDVSEIYSTDVTSPEFKELLVRLYQNLNNMSLVLNLKDTGMYNTAEFVNSQVYFSDPGLTSLSTTKPTLRQVFRKVINFGVLPNNATKTVAHGLTPSASWSFTRIYGCASDPIAFEYLPLPYASPTLADNIELSVDAVNVSVRTAANWTAFTVCYIIIEYIKT